MKFWELVGVGYDNNRDGRPSIRRPWLVTEASTDDEATVEAAFRAELTDQYQDLWLLSVSVTDRGAGIWSAEATYGVPQTTDAAAVGNPMDPGQTPPETPASSDVLGPEWSFSTMGGTERVTVSLGIKGYNAIDGYTAPTGRAIGTRQDGSVEGVEVVGSKIEIKTTRKGFVTLGYLKRLGEMTGTINDAEFMGMPEGCVLFVGAEGSSQAADGGQFTITYHFAYNPVIASGTVIDTGLTLADDKRGWDYLWVTYSERATATGKETFPTAYRVDQVYKETDFTDLGLGG